MNRDVKTLLAVWRGNPWFVLGLDPDAARIEIERTAQKLLGLLALGSATSSEYATPLGPGRRDADAVRQALGVLRDPDRRLLCELWATLELPADREGSTSERVEAWKEAPAAVGWRSRCRAS